LFFEFLDMSYRGGMLAYRQEAAKPPAMIRCGLKAVHYSALADQARKPFKVSAVPTLEVAGPYFT
jgi:hypothetical protein